MTDPTPAAPAGTPAGPTTTPTAGPAHTGVDTVEAVVRRQMAKALGGRRGMFEAAVPTLLFTVVYLTTKELRSALTVSVAAALLLLVVRVAQRSTPQFVLNALFGIGIGWFFVTLAARNGGTENEQALAYFLPGLIYNSAWGAVLVLTVVVGWPLVGFMVGSVAGDPTAWHADRQLVRLCSRLTLVFAAPCLLRAVVQWPVWLAGSTSAVDQETVIGIMGVLKVAMGWPLQIATFAVMIWLLARNHTPVEPVAGAADGR